MIKKHYPTLQDLLIVHFPCLAQTPEPLVASVHPSVLRTSEALSLRAQNLPSCLSGVANLVPAKHPATSTDGQVFEPVTINIPVSHKHQTFEKDRLHTFAFLTHYTLCILAY